MYVCVCMYVCMYVQISKLLVVDPKERLTAEEALNHPFFKREEVRVRVVCFIIYLRHISFSCHGSVTNAIDSDMVEQVIAQPLEAARHHEEHYHQERAAEWAMAPLVSSLHNARSAARSGTSLRSMFELLQIMTYGSHVVSHV